LLALLTCGERLLRGGQGGLIWCGREVALLCVEDDPRAFRDIKYRLTERNERWNAHCCSENRDMRSRPACGEADARKSRRIERDELRRLQVLGDEDRALGQIAHDDRRLTVQREQHLGFQIQQVIDALTHARVAECAQRVGAVANCTTPCEAGALAARDRAACGGDEFPVVQKFQMCGDDFASGALRGRGELLEARSNRRTGAFEFFGFVRDAFAGFGDLNFGAFERDGATDREAAAGDNAAQAVGLALLPDRSCSNGRGGFRRATRLFIQRQDQLLELANRLRRAFARRDQRQLIALLRAQRHQRHRALRVRAATARRDRNLGSGCLGRIRNQRGRPRMDAMIVRDDHALRDFLRRRLVPPRLCLSTR
jgi:hypothetical protein